MARGAGRLRSAGSQSGCTTRKSGLRPKQFRSIWLRKAGQSLFPNGKYQLPRCPRCRGNHPSTGRKKCLGRALYFIERDPLLQGFFPAGGAGLWRNCTYKKSTQLGDFIRFSPAPPPFVARAGQRTSTAASGQKCAANDFLPQHQGAGLVGFRVSRIDRDPGLGQIALNQTYFSMRAF